jgi:[ribosomal protein S18]-alanine N-acetyltransferase
VSAAGTGVGGARNGGAAVGGAGGGGRRVRTAVLRPMRWWDIPAVTVLEHTAFPEDAWSVGMFWSELAETTTRYYLVAEERGPDPTHPDPGGPRIVGYAGLLAGIGEAEVQTIAVDPAREGGGLGGSLLTELLCEAARRDCDDVVLEVRVDNSRAQDLYRRFGFAPVGVRKGYYQPAGVDALVMRTGHVMSRYSEEQCLEDQTRPGRRPDDQDPVHQGAARAGAGRTDRDGHGGPDARRAGFAP